MSNIDTVEKALEKLWVRANKYVLTVVSAKDQSGRRIMLETNHCARDQALAALSNLYDKAALMEKIEAARSSHGCGDKICDAETTGHNRAIDTILTMIKGDD